MSSRDPLQDERWSVTLDGISHALADEFALDGSAYDALGQSVLGKRAAGNVSRSTARGSRHARTVEPRSSTARRP